MNRLRRRSPIDAGFSLVELLVVIALIGLLSLWGLPNLLGSLNRLKLTNTAREAAVFMQIARMEATKRSVDAHVIYQDAATALTGKPELLAFADLDSDGAFVAANDRVLAGPYGLPPGIQLWGPLETNMEGASAIDGWDTAIPANDGPIFASNGSAQGAGAFRFRDRNGNFIETRVEFPGTGKVVIQKWFGPGDLPTSWFENGESGNRWQW